MIDNNETGLTNLNRDINLSYPKKILRKLEYICEDINNINLHNVIKENKITHYLNFSALKHVRSEENFISTLNMFKTNSFSPFKMGKIKNLSSLKQIFFISTDKAAYPSSLMGCSKKIMEHNLYDLKKNNKKIIVSTIRFANVSFSNGSLLQNILNKVQENKPFGVPEGIRRFFITHKESTNLCFKALLKESDNHIVLPTYKSLGNSFNLLDLAEKIVKTLKKKPVISASKKKIRINEQLIIVNKNTIRGQKQNEILYEPKEKLDLFKNDGDLIKIKFYQNKKVRFFQKKIMRSENLNQIKNFCSKVFSIYTPKKIKTILVKNII